MLAYRSWRCFTLLLVVSGCKQEAMAQPTWIGGEPVSPAASGPSVASQPSDPRPSSASPETGPDAPAESKKASLSARYGTRPALATFSGEAAYYSDSLAGRPTASGRPYDPKSFTCAHRELPFGTILRVTRPDTGKVVYVEVTDRGPFGDEHRVIDLSRAAAAALGMMQRGVAPVRVEVVARPE